MERTSSKPRSAFTLVELLVVISIIALLIAILLPSLSKARKQARKVICQTNMRSLSQAAFTYTVEWGVYPPSISNFADSSNAAVRAMRTRGGIDWLGVGDQSGAFMEGDPKDPQTGNPKGFTAAPNYGVLFPLVKDPKAYLCAEDRPGPRDNPISVLGGGGNGKFSFTIFSNLGLRSPDKIPPRHQELPGGGRSGPRTGELLPRRALAGVPLFVEEHPWGINNKESNNGHIEGNFNFGTDFVVSRHPPFNKRNGIPPSGAGVASFTQGTSNIGFADGHVDDIYVNFGFTPKQIKPKSLGGDGYVDDIPYTAEGLLYYYGLEYDVVTIE